MNVEHRFVGARPLLPGEPFLGREEILDELCQRLLAERIVLLHSPSGVGKTSLIRAGLIPYFNSREFQVPIGDATAGMLMDGMTSRTLADLLFDQLEPTGDGEDATKPKLIVIDQCEEIFAREEDKPLRFIIELAELCQRRDVWVLVAVREDFLGTLLAVGKAIPGALRERVRLELMDPDQVHRLIDASVLGSDHAADKVRRDLKLLCNDALERSGLSRGISPMIVQVLAVTYLGRSHRPKSGTGGSERGASIESLLAEYIDQTLQQIAPGPGKSDGDEEVCRWVMRIWMESSLTRGSTERDYCRVEQIPSDISSETIELFVDRGILTRYAEGRIGFSHDRFVPAARMSNRAYQRHPKYGFEYNVARWRSSAAWKWNLATLLQATSGLTSWHRLGRTARAFALKGLIRSTAWLLGLATLLGVAWAIASVASNTNLLASELATTESELKKKLGELEVKQGELDRAQADLDSRQQELGDVEASLHQISDLNLARMQARLVSWTVPARSAIRMLLPPAGGGPTPSGRSLHFARLLALELLSSKIRIHRELLGADALAERTTPPSICGLEIDEGGIRYVRDCRSPSRGRWTLDAPENDEPSNFGGAGSLKDFACRSSGSLRPAAFPLLRLHGVQRPAVSIDATSDANAVDSAELASTSILMTASRMSEARVFARPAEFDCYTSLDPSLMTLGAVVATARGIVGISTTKIGTGRARSTTAHLWRLSSEAIRRCLEGLRAGSAHSCPYVEIFGHVHVGSGNWSVVQFDVEETEGLSARLTSDQSQQVRIWAGTPESIPTPSSRDEWVKFIQVEDGERVVVTASQYCLADACRTGDMRPLLDGEQAYPLALFPAGTFSAWKDTVVLLRNGWVVPLSASDKGPRSVSRKSHLRTKTGPFAFERRRRSPEVLFHPLGSGGIAYHRGTPTNPSEAWTLEWDDSKSVWDVSELDPALKSALLVEPDVRIGAIGGHEGWVLIATHRLKEGAELSICRVNERGPFECPEVRAAKLGAAPPVSIDVIPFGTGYVAAAGLESGVISLTYLAKNEQGRLVALSQVDTEQAHSGNAVVTLVPSGEAQRLLLVSGGTERAVAVHTVMLSGSDTIGVEPWGYVADFASPVFVAERTASRTGGAAALVGSIYGEVALLNLKDEDLVEQLCRSLGQSGEALEPGCPPIAR
jgi:hypothetical protein